MEISETDKNHKIQSLVDKLNTIQSKAYTDGRISYDDKMEWRALTNDLKFYGYILRKKTIKNAWGRRINTIWRAIPSNEVTKRTRHFSAEWKNVDMTPNDGKPTCKGNCTTRSLAYCLQGIFTYREIEHEQYRLATEANNKKGYYHGDGRRKMRRNTTGVWDKIMCDLGYVWISFNGMRTIRRDNLALALQNMKYPIITHSAHHVAVVDKGMVVDSWDSRHGRCDRILIKADDKEKVLEILINSGVL